MFLYFILFITNLDSINYYYINKYYFIETKIYLNVLLKDAFNIQPFVRSTNSYIAFRRYINNFTKICEIFIKFKSMYLLLNQIIYVTNILILFI